jgi:hypothetical protein
VGVVQATHYDGNLLMTTLGCCYSNFPSLKYDCRMCYIHIYTFIYTYVTFVCFCVVAFLCKRV